ncbi:MAG: hypothetical protein C0599_03260 [Salinivirgaceae bacterium]|nr:MAG: hypothetical protein C0599_03260 [Salinivirgaceae bacterium]
MQVITFIIGIIIAFIGLALVLFGKQLFKYYIILCGILLGVLIGGIVGGAIDLREGVIPGMIIGGIFLGIIAWPIHKVFVFIISGTLIGLVCTILSGLLGVEGNGLVTVFILFFIAGGVLTLYFYDYLIIIIMAISGAQLIFNATYYNSFDFFSRRRPNLNYFFDDLINYYTEHYIELLFFIVSFTLLALLFQKFLNPNIEKNIQNKPRKRIFRNTTYVIILLYILIGSIKYLLWYNYQVRDYSYDAMPALTYFVGLQFVTANIILIYFLTIQVAKIKWYTAYVQYGIILICVIFIFPIVDRILISAMTYGAESIHNIKWIITPNLERFIQSPYGNISVILSWIIWLLLYPGAIYYFVVRKYSSQLDK